MDRNSNAIGLVAYNFEPEYSEEEMMSRSQHSIAEASSADVRTLEEWCSIWMIMNAARILTAMTL
jgi:hypothetical protein